MEEEESSCPCVECEVPRDLLLHTDQLIPPLEIGFKRFEENELDSATILEERRNTESYSYRREESSSSSRVTECCVCLSSMRS